MSNLVSPESSFWPWKLQALKPHFICSSTDARKSFLIIAFPVSPRSAEVCHLQCLHNATTHSLPLPRRRFQIPFRRVAVFLLVQFAKREDSCVAMFPNFPFWIGLNAFQISFFNPSQAFLISCFISWECICGKDWGKHKQGWWTLSPYKSHISAPLSMQPYSHRHILRGHTEYPLPSPSPEWWWCCVAIADFFFMFHVWWNKFYCFRRNMRPHHGNREHP